MAFENEENPDSQDQSELDTAEMDAEMIAKAVQSACEDLDVADSDPDSELKAEKDRIMRLQAEMENLRSRTAREINDERKYGALPVIRDLLPAIDNIDRAIQAAEQASEASSLLEGFKLVRQQLLTVLQQHHCLPIETVGQPFDPQVHEAILQQPSDEQPANYVLHEAQAGYQLHDRVVRAPQVIVSTGPAEA